MSLRILSRLSESYAAKEQYRTTRLLASVQKSQMVTLQYNLEQFKKHATITATISLRSRDCWSRRNQNLPWST